MSSAGFGPIRATPDELNAVFNEALAPAPLASSAAERTDHVHTQLYRHTSVSARYLTAVLNNTAAGQAQRYSRVEVQRCLEELLADGRAIHCKTRGWRRS